MTMVSR